MVVLTDGQDVDSTLRAQDVIERLKQRGDSDRRVRVFTIAYSPDALQSRGALRAIARVSGGAAYAGTTADIASVYRSIGSFF